MGCREVHKAQVGIHTHLDHAALCCTALGSCAGDGGHHQSGGSREGVGLSLRGTDGHGSAAHHLEHVQVAGFNGTVGAQSHIHAVLDAGQNVGTGTALLGITQRGDHSGGLVLGENLPVHFAQRVAAGDGGRHIQHPVAAHQLRLGQAGPVLAGLVLLSTLGQV